MKLTIFESFEKIKKDTAKLQRMVDGVHFAKGEDLWDRVKEGHCKRCDRFTDIDYQENPSYLCKSCKRITSTGN